MPPELQRPELQRPELQRPEPPAYRPSRGGTDPTTKRLGIAAGAIGVVLLALVGGWSLAGRHAGGIPVIEPPSGPERVKPADPGGMQLMGAEPPPANNDAGGTGGTALAPAPEKPDRGALQAELDRATRDSATTEPPAVRPAAPVTAAPITAPHVTAPAPPPAPAPSPAAVTGHLQVQLAAMDTQAAAQAEWARLARHDPALFADRRPVVTTATRDGKTFYRLRTGGFATVASATDFCGRARAAGAACTIAAF